MFDGPWSGVLDTIRCGVESSLSQIIVDPSDTVVFLGAIGFWLGLGPFSKHFLWLLA
jgi:hypothetical protein